jgi:hypothetical protein
MPDFNRSRKVWHGHLLRWGQDAALSAKAVRGGTERPMVMAMSQWNPRERASIAIDNAVRMVVSAHLVEPANYIDFTQDNLRFAGKEYRIVTAPLGQQPDGTWIAWDCTCALVGTVEEEIS